MGAETYSEAARLRQADADAADERTRVALPAAAGAPAMVAVTTTVTTYPTTAGRFYAVVPSDVTGTESEGSSGAVTAGSSGGLFYALNLGSTIPPNGTQVLVYHVPHRWVFRYDG